MDYRILGPVEVCQDGETLRLGGDKQRALLAILLLHAGEVVAADRLIDGLWGERPPPTALKALQVHVSRLRRTLDGNGDAPDGVSGGVLVTRGHGYLLRVGAGELDLDRFRDLAEEGRRTLAAGDAQRAASLLEAALGLWRGPPLADLTYEAFAQRAIAELEELRLGAVEERVDADLALGRHGQLVGELRTLVNEQPLRERLRGQLMLALYRCGRQAEALEIYQDFRRGLARELGLDPSQRLQQLDAAILKRDPSLAAPVTGPPSAAAEASASPPRRSTRKRTRKQLTLAGLVLIAAAAAVLVSSGGGGTMIAADSVGAISASDGSLSATVPISASPSTVAAGEGAVWVANYNDGTVSKVDAARHAVVQTIPVDSTPSGIAVGDGAVWVANTFSGTLSRIDPKLNRVVAPPITVGNGPSGVAVGYGSVWVTNSNDGTLSRINAVTDSPSKRIALGGSPTGVAAGYQALWVSDEPARQVVRVDPTTNQSTDSINVGNGPTAITVGFGSVWVTNSLDGTISRIDPRTDEVTATITVGYGPNAIAAGAGGVWVANELGETVTRIDPARSRVTERIRVGNRPEGVAIAHDLAWVSVQASDTNHHGGTLTVLTSTPFDTNDPANVTANYAPGLTLYMTNDGLTAFKRTGGSDGTEVVPDLAVSLPSPADNGLTYRFQLRRGIRYSNGQLVRPEDFLYAIERGFKLYSFAYPEYFGSLVGGAACAAHPARCDLKQGIIPDDATNTVTFHLVAPDPEFLKRLASVYAVAVPPGTPIESSSTNLPTPLPATGAYEIARYSPNHEVQLVRNPYFHEWSHDARPNGYPDQIVWKIGASPSTAVTTVERGRADYTLDAPPADRLREVRTRFASQLHPNPNDVTAVLFLNTRVPPFNDVRVRRALNYAVDRRELTTLIGLDSQPTCQLIPPYVQGYQRYCPYPNAEGLDKARALIAASHTRGMRITIWSQPSFGVDYTLAGRYVAALLDRLGYKTRLRTFAPTDASFYNFNYPQTRAQAAFATAVPVYPMASEFIQFLYSCRYISSQVSWGPNMSEFCSPRLDATMQRALAAENSNATNANVLWASADRQLTNDAPLVPLVNPSELDFVSSRVGDYQYNPVQGPLLDQIWVR